MHLAIVCRGLGATGSVAAVALRQARELSRSLRVTLVSDSFAPDEMLPHVRVRVPNLVALRRFAHVPDELAFAFGARRAVRALGADLVLCHSHTTAYVAPKPLAMFVHGDISDRPEGTYDARLTALYRFVTPRAYRKADVVFAPARAFAELASKQGAKRVEWLPHGIDPAEIGATEVARTSSSRLRLLYVGRLAIEKGLAHLLDACELLNIDYELDLVGAGPLESQLRARANDRIRFLGPRPRPTLGSIYAEHDVFVLPALSEPFGLVVAEALVCGLPVIASRVGGIPDLVTDGENGLLVPPADPRALADAITTFARDENLRARLAANARASVLPRLEWPAIGARMSEVLTTMRA